MTTKNGCPVAEDLGGGAFRSAFEADMLDVVVSGLRPDRLLAHSVT
jgi:hypothetical protein